MHRIIGIVWVERMFGTRTVYWAQETVRSISSVAHWHWDRSRSFLGWIAQTQLAALRPEGLKCTECMSIIWRYEISSCTFFDPMLVVATWVRHLRDHWCERGEERSIKAAHSSNTETRLDVTTSGLATKYHAPQKEIPSESNLRNSSLRYPPCVEDCQQCWIVHGGTETKPCALVNLVLHANGHFYCRPMTKDR